MARIAQRFQNILNPTSAGGTQATAAELEQALQGASADEVRDFAARAIDTCADTDAMAQVANRIGLDALPAKLGRFGDHPSTAAWKNGDFALVRYAQTTAAQEATVLMQRALIKIGAHHPNGAAVQSLLQLPYGADGDLGGSTVAALNAAMNMAGRPDLANLAVGDPVSHEVANVLDGLLGQTPSINHPALLNVAPSPPPATTAPSQPSGVTPADLVHATNATNAAANNPLSSLWGKTAQDISSNPMSKWTDVLGRIDAESHRYDGGPGDQLTGAAKYWQEELDAINNPDPSFQVNRVNSFINEWPYTSDQQLYGQSDKWATPLEFLGRGTGDCEDYAICKYESLRRLGFPEEKMRLVAVQDLQAAVAHMILVVDVGGELRVLDNQYQAAMNAEDIQLSDGDPRYVPLYAMNREGKWLYT